MSVSLPHYLIRPYCASPRRESVVVCGDARFTVITPRMIRMECGAFTDEATTQVICRDFSSPDFTVSEDAETLTIRTEFLQLSYRKGAAFAPDTLSIRLLDTPRTHWRWGEQPKQNLGGTTCTLDGIDGACPVENGVCSLDGFALLNDSASPLMLENGWFSPRQPCTDVYFFGYGHDYTASVQDLYRLTGAPGMLPAYVLGNWWSRYHRYTAEEYLTLMERFRQEDVPLSVAIVDMDWHLTDGDGRDYYADGWTGYTWNKQLFPDWQAFLRRLHEMNLKTALNLHPAYGVRAWDEQYEDMAKALGRKADGKPIPFDALDPAFLKAYFEVLHFPYEEKGVDFWWMDWQQGTDYSWLHQACEKPHDPLEKSITPLWLLNHMHYLASQRNGKRGLIFSRFSGVGSQRYPIGFSGDTYITWRSLDFQPGFTAMASNIGYGWWSHDIGGHMGGVKDDELTVRWIQFGVFSPIFRLHSTASFFLGREPWNYNKRAELIIERFMRLRHQLFPYLYTMCYRNCTQLLPLMRPMYHTHPECQEAYEVRNEYWFGSEMVVAPITKKQDDVSSRGGVTVWLPEGLWIDLMNGYVYPGGKRQVFRPMEEIPVFGKAGAIIPMQPHIPGENHLGLRDHVEVLVAAGASNELTLYEDDGVTNDFQNGHSCLTTFRLCWAGTTADFTVEAAQGDLSLVPQKRAYTIRFRGIRSGAQASMNGRALPASYDKTNCTLTVRVPETNVTSAFTLTLAHPEGLLHDDQDCRDRAMDILLRAQCATDEKQRLADTFDRMWKTVLDARKKGVSAQLRISDVTNGHSGDLAQAVLEPLLALRDLPLQE